MLTEERRGHFFRVHELEAALRKAQADGEVMKEQVCAGTVFGGCIVMCGLRVFWASMIQSQGWTPRNFAGWHVRGLY